MKSITSFTGERCFLFSSWTKTFNICLICCCHSPDNHLSTFNKMRALKNSQVKLLFLIPAICSCLSYLSGQLEPCLWGVSIHPEADRRLLVTLYCRQRRLSVCLERFFHCVETIRVRLKHACGTATEKTASSWLGAGQQNEEVWAPWEGDRERWSVWRKTKFSVCGVRRCCQCVTQYPVFTDQGSAHNTSMFSVQKCQIMRFFLVFPAGATTQGPFNISVYAHIIGKHVSATFSAIPSLL